MASFDFSFVFDNQLKYYEELILPTIFTDRSLAVRWSNNTAKRTVQFADMSVAHNFLFSELDERLIYDKVKEGCIYTAAGIIPFYNGVANFFPVVVNEELVGYLVIFINSIAVPDKQDMDYVSKASEVAYSHLNTSIDIMFQAKETLVLKADILESKWVFPYTGTINEENYKLLRFTKNMAIYNQVQNNIVKINKHAVNISRWLTKQLPEIEAMLEIVNISLVVNLPREEILLPVDIINFEIAFFNILHNSIYYTRKNNTITISITQDDQWAYICIDDKGLGMPKEILKKALIPFFSRSPMGQLSNVGLGLPIAAIILKLHGGSITIDSAEGAGTKIIMTLPADTFRYITTFAQNEKETHLKDKFSPVYVGLTTALYSPFHSQ